MIMSITLCTKNMEDFWAWHFEKKGSFTVRSAYRMLVAIRKRIEDWLKGNEASSNTALEEKAGTSLWKVDVLARIRTFYGLLPNIQL